MKRNGFIIAAILIVFGAALWQWSASTTNNSSEEVSTEVEITDERQTAPLVTVIIDYGDGTVIEYGDIPAGNPYDAALNVAIDNDIDIQTKQYDFGVLVESIDGKVNSAEQAWIYYINGQSGSVAAIEYELATGDRVEWKFEKPE